MAPDDGGSAGKITEHPLRERIIFLYEHLFENNPFPENTGSIIFLSHYFKLLPGFFTGKIIPAISIVKAFSSCYGATIVFVCKVCALK